MATRPIPKGCNVFYKTLFPVAMSRLDVEMWAIKQGGHWRNTPNGDLRGEGLPHHIEEMQRVLWPEKDHHRWSKLLLSNISTHRFTGIMGPASTGKTHEPALYALCLYYCFPKEMTVLCSSTEREMLEMRVWGEIKKYHRIAVERNPQLSGHLIESRQRIVTDPKDEAVDGRDFRNGLCGVPCKKGGSYVGLGSYSGIKNKRMILIADELQFMQPAFVTAIANLNKNPGFQCIGIGNPKETTDPLGQLCEPAPELGGWDGGIDQTGKSKTWPTRFPGGICIQLVGTDCPNMDVSPDQPAPYPYLIKQSDIDADIAFYGRDSLQYTMMDEGRMPRGQGLRRVITRAMCEKFRALDPVIWKGTPRTKIGFLDAAYGAVGGDRCVFGELEFGQGLDQSVEKMMLALVDIMIVPVNAKLSELPEDQIALWVKEQCERRVIIPQNFFFDSTGRGSLMGSFARLWSPYVVGIEFGGRPTDRIVSEQRRVLCSDYYSKFVTELWWSVRLVIEAGQFRGMTAELMSEGTMREWTIVGANKIEVEPKDKMKLRMGRSPDMFDGLVAGVEGARRRGFQIGRLSNAEAAGDDRWEELAEKLRARARYGRLNYAAA